MEYRQLEQSDLKTSVVTFAAWALKETNTQLLGEVVLVGAVQKRTPWQRFKYKWNRFWHR